MGFGVESLGPSRFGDWCFRYGCRISGFRVLSSGLGWELCGQGFRVSGCLFRVWDVIQRGIKIATLDPKAASVFLIAGISKGRECHVNFKQVLIFLGHRSASICL